MSRWLWALLGGVDPRRDRSVFWTASNPTMSLPQFPQSQRLSPLRGLPTRTAQEAAPSPPSSPAPPPAQEAAAPPPPAPIPPPLPLRLRRPMRDSKPPRGRSPPRRPPRRPLLRPSPPRTLPPTCSRSAGRSSPAASRARTGVAGSRGHLCAREPCAAGRDLGLFRGGL